MDRKTEALALFSAGGAGLLVAALLLLRGGWIIRFAVARWRMRALRRKFDGVARVIRIRGNAAIAGEARSWIKPEAQTPLEFAAAIPGASDVSMPVALTELYQSARFGKSSRRHAGQMSALLSAIRDAAAPARQILATMKFERSMDSPRPAAAAIAVLFFVPAIPQNEAYHNFADKRAPLGIPNGLDVLSNVFFSARRRGRALDRLSHRAILPTRASSWPYAAFFLGVTLTAFGSSWYHLNPNDATLVWDRIPMTVGFLGLVSALLAERVSVRADPLWLLVPLVALGIASAFYWELTQQRGARRFAAVRFRAIGWIAADRGAADCAVPGALHAHLRPGNFLRALRAR